MGDIEMTTTVLTQKLFTMILFYYLFKFEMPNKSVIFTPQRPKTISKTCKKYLNLFYVVNKQYWTCFSCCNQITNFVKFFTLIQKTPVKYDYH